MERALKLVGARDWGWRLGLIALALVCSVTLAQWKPLQWADLQLHDWLTRSLPQQPVPAQITLVDIDERSLAELGPWPWPRPVMARLMQTLRERGAKLQVWDVFFADSAQGNASIAAQLRAGSDIVLGQVLILDPKINRPPQAGQLKSSTQAPVFCSAQVQTKGYFGVAQELQPEWVGHISATPDADGRLRRLPAVLCDEAQQHYPQLTIAAAMALEPGAQWVLKPGRFPLGPAQWLERGSLRFALDGQGYLTIPYAREHTAWPAVSASQLLMAGAQLPSLQGQIVIIGASALGVGDNVSTPRHPNAPGVSVHSELLSAALDGNWLIAPQAPATFAALLTLLMVLALLPVARPQRTLAAVVTCVALALLVPMLVALLGRLGDVMLPVAAPSLTLVVFGIGVLAAKADSERRRAQQLALHLESFLPQRLAREIAFQSPGSDSLGRPCQGVLLAVQVQGLERWTSTVDSLQALGVAHAISTLAERAASANGGALEHVRGEVLLMAWPRADAQCGSAAIEAAHSLLQTLTPLLRQNESLRFPMGLQAAIESGAFLLGVAGPQASRRPLLLGPVADIVLAMLPFCDELAAPLLIGPQVAQAQPTQKLVLIGQFLLPDHAQPQSLYRVEL